MIAHILNIIPPFQMPRMTKSNARVMLDLTMKNFTNVTGESVGVVFSWKGQLSVLGTDSYKVYVTANKRSIWRKLAFTTQKIISKPAHDVEMNNMLDDDLNKCNVPTLRKRISWVTQKSIGKLNHSLNSDS